jgi:hypothetical protein
MSPKTALDQPGYKTLHASTVHELTLGYVYWNEAIDPKSYAKGKPYVKAELDKLLKQCTAISNMPAIVFVDELLAAYPDAQVVLTTRDIDSWLASFNNSVYVVLEARLNRLHAVFPPPKALEPRLLASGEWSQLGRAAILRTVISCAKGS